MAIRFELHTNRGTATVVLDSNETVWERGRNNGFGTFSEHQAWVKGSWVFDRLLADAKKCAPDNAQLTEILRNGNALGIICVDALDESTRRLLVSVLTKVIRETVSNSSLADLSWHQGLDENMQTRYKQALVELGGMMGLIDLAV